MEMNTLKTFLKE